MKEVMSLLPDNRGSILVDALVAIAILAAAAVPIVSFLQAGARGVRPLESDLIVGNVAMDILERLAVPPAAPDPLRRILAGSPILDASQTVQVTEIFVGPLPRDVTEALERYEVSLEIDKKHHALGRSYFDVDAGGGLEIWTVTARWRVGKREKKRRFFRVSAVR